MDSNNWRTGLPQDSRQKIVKRIMDTLQRHMPPTGSESMGELLKIAWRFEEKIFQAATDQQDYLRKISLKMLSLETKAQATPPNNMARLGGGVQGVQGVQGVSGVQGGVKPLDSSALLMNQAQGLGNTISMPGQVGGQAQQRQQAMGQTMQSNMNANVLQNGSGLGQNPSNMTVMPQNSLTSNPAANNTHPNSFMNTQRLQQMQQQQQQRQQQPQQQQQPPSVHQQQMLYQQQVQQQQMMKAKMQQQQQHNLLQQQQSLQQQQQQVPTLQQQQPANQLLSQTGNVTSALQQQQLMQQQMLQVKQQQMQQQQQAQQQQQQQQVQQAQQQQPSVVQSSSQQNMQGQPPGQNQQSQQLQQQQAVNQQVQQAQQQRLQTSGGMNQQQASLYDLQQQQKQQQQQQQSSVDSAGGSVMDHRDIVWPKLQVLKDKYLQDMKELYAMLTQRSTAPMPPEQLQKLKHYKDVLNRMIPYLIAPKERVPREFNQDKVEAFEKQIVNIMETFKRRKQPTTQQPNVAPQQQQGGQSQQMPQQQQQQLMSQMQQQDNKLMQQMPMSSGGQSTSSHQANNLGGSLGPGLQQTGMAPLQQPPGASSIQTTGANLQSTSQQSGVTSHQPSGMSAMQPGGLSTVQQSGVSSLPPNAVSSLPQNGVNTLQPNGMSTLQQNNVLPLQQSVPGGMNTMQQGGSSLQQPGAVGSLQQGTGVNPLQQQSGATVLQTNTILQPGANPLQQNVGSLQQQQLLHQQRMLKDQEQAKQQQQLQQQQRQLQQQQMMQQQEQHKVQAQMHAHQHSQQQLQDFSKQDAIKEEVLKARQVAANQVLRQQQHIKQRQLFQAQMQQQAQQQQQRQSVGSPQMPSQLVSSPQMLQSSSPQISIAQQMSPQPDHQNFAAPLQVNKVPTPLQATTPPLRTPSPSLLQVTSPPLHEEGGDLKTSTPAIATPGTVQSSQIVAATPSSAVSVGAGTPGPSPLMAEFSPSPQDARAISQDAMQPFSPGTPLADKTNLKDPLERLITQVDTISHVVLDSAVGELSAVVSCHDRLGASAPGSGSRAAVGEDLSLITKARLQTRGWPSPDGPPKKRLRHMDSVALSLVGHNGHVTNSVHRSEAVNSLDTRTMIMANHRSPRMKVPVTLQEEIKYVNQILIDTEIEISEEGTEEAAAQGKEGVVVTCSYKGAAVSPTYTHRNKLVSLPLVWLLIPPSYPECSPVIWSEHMAPNASYSVVAAARDEFTREVRALAAPVSLKDMAGVWDRCARQALAEAATYHGGGTFSSSIGMWESFVSV